MNHIQIKNPWGPKPFQGEWTRRKWGEFRFLNQPCSVVAVLHARAITQCVTVNGAIRELQRRGYKAKP